MRLALLCGGLEPGRDGVGDYSRQLGAEFEKRGHEVLLISLNDHWHHGPAASQLPVLRFGAATPAERRAETALALLECFDPDWVSVQYVCYAYHPKGLAWRWNPIFAQLGSTGRCRHLMLHELWSGEGGHPPLRHRLIGLGQRWCIRNLHRNLQPEVVTTSIPVFKCRLSSQGIPAALLPLFGNIRVVPRDDARISALLAAAGSRIAQSPRASFLNGVFFGTIHPDFDVVSLIQWLAQLRQQSQKRLLLTMIGRTGAAADHIIQQVTRSLPGPLEVISLAEQPAAVVSQTLQFADFGINTGSSDYLGKSGTFAAMREHGLPVVVADGELDSQLRTPGAPPVLQFSTADSVSVLMRRMAANPAGLGVARVVDEMIELFEKSAA